MATKNGITETMFNQIINGERDFKTIIRTGIDKCDELSIAITKDICFM